MFTFQGWIWMDLNITHLHLHIKPTKVVQWHRSSAAWLCKLSHTSHGVLKICPCQIQGKSVLLPREGLNSQKIPPKLENQCLIIALKWGNIRDLLVSLGSSISISEGREDAPGWWKTLFRLSNLWLQKVSGVKNICGYLNSHFDGYTQVQVITWNPGHSCETSGLEG